MSLFGQIVTAKGTTLTNTIFQGNVGETYQDESRQYIGWTCKGMQRADLE